MTFKKETAVKIVLPPGITAPKWLRKRDLKEEWTYDGDGAFWEDGTALGSLYRIEYNGGVEKIDVPLTWIQRS